MPVGGIYTYVAPLNWKSQLRVGCRVLVPVKESYTTGFVVKVRPNGRQKQLKEVIDVLDAAPLFDSTLLRLTQWISKYYFCPWGEVLKAALPAGLHQESQLTIRLKEPYSDRLLQKADRLIANGSKMIQAVHEKGEVRFSTLRKIFGQEGLRVILKTLERRGYIEVKRSLGKARVGTLHETWVVLTKPDQMNEGQIEQLRKRAPRQATCLDILTGIEENTIPSSELIKKHGIHRDALQRLRTKGLVEFVKKQIMRDPYKEVPVEAVRNVALTPDQNDVLQQIVPFLRNSEFKAVLLHGVTGSGKTEVYIRALKQTLKCGKKAIVFVPEIVLTSQTVARFRYHFPDRIAVLHSRLSLGERYDMWRRIQEGTVDVVVGARSAVFAPIKPLGLIVIDEEHESAYKQSEFLPRYHARDVAIMRAQFSKAVVVLGSATPSIESYYNATMGKYVKCTLPHRIENRPLPPVTIINLCEERRKGNWGVFSKKLQKKIQEQKDDGQQVILLQNRRGFSSYIQCEECGYVAACRKCNVTLTYHAAERSLRCHYCNARHSAPALCPKCGNYRLRYRGIGTQRIEKEMHTLFPTIKVLRMDVDTTRKKGAHDRLLKLFGHGDADVLLGTQMVAKGLDFPSVGLVGVIDADVGLNLPDFRAGERTFQLLTQVAGRTGRGDIGGEVIIQTYTPDQPSIALAGHHDYLSFYEQELRQRQEVGYPPFNRLINVLVHGKREHEVETQAVKLTEGFCAYADENEIHSIHVLGPAPAPLEKIMENYRWQTLLKGDNPRLLGECVKAGLNVLRTGQHPRGIKVIIDVDPIEML